MNRYTYRLYVLAERRRYLIKINLIMLAVTAVVSVVGVIVVLGGN